jgi:hypothetical protein
MQMFRDEDAHKYLFKYMTDDAFTNYYMADRRLRMAPLAYMNDPKEAQDWYCTLVADADYGDDLDVHDISAAFTTALKRRAKVLCFTRDDPTFEGVPPAHLYGRGYAHSSLWDRYASQHRGVCLVFEIDALDEAMSGAATHGTLYRRWVSYDDAPSSEVDAFTIRASELRALGREALLERHVRDHHSTLYFFKSSDWQREFEYRWLLLAEGDDEFVYIESASALRGVILGADFAESPESVRAAVGDDVVVARMRWHNGHPSVLPA